jgi:hypothetical protein
MGRYERVVEIMAERRCLQYLFRFSDKEGPGAERLVPSCVERKTSVW